MRERAGGVSNVARREEAVVPGDQRALDPPAAADPEVGGAEVRVTIPAGATSVLTPVSAVGEGSTTLTAEATGYATATAAVTVVLPPPTLTSFSPTSGPVGTAD